MHASIDLGNDLYRPSNGDTKGNDLATMKDYLDMTGDRRVTIAPGSPGH